MKKIIAMLLAVMLIVSLAACGAKTETGKDNTPAGDQTPTTSVDATEPDATEGTGAETDATEGTEVESTEPEVQVSDLCELLSSISAAKPMQFPTMVMDVDLTDEFGVNAYTGLENADEIDSAAFCEAMMGSQAYSVVVVKIKDATKAEEIAKKMYEGINPRKWICVCADDLKVAATDNLIILAMVDTEYAADATAADIIDAFATIKGAPTVKFGY